MNITRWDPFRELEEVSERLNRLFGRTLPSRTSEKGRESINLPEWIPSVDILETSKNYQVKIELPEVRKEDVKVNVSDGILRIEGERKQEKEENGKKFHRLERYYGSFQRSFTMPSDVDESKIRAEFKEGLLNILLPKSEKAKSKSVEVKIS